MNAKNKKSSLKKTTCSLCQFTDNSTILYTKNKLSLHQKQLHPNNHVVPHIEQSVLDSISDTQESFTYIPYLKKYKCTFTGKDWGEKNHNSGTKAYVFMENKEQKKDVTFIWSDFVVTRIRDGKEPLILHSPKLVVSFTISTGYFIQS
ncbi:hypothetical protein GLOIN_2v1886663 [Rhizophagus irregularis DAOM 181602=DAOM 197198]|nr:hypothetical protein RhiirB3_456251 [Rhizophagus irregularis]GET55490.1 hypothetical protein GLOIN_2v1886663 [Rhizophagus irregularis DAOM 181602=DAOM 197198]